MSSIQCSSCKSTLPEYSRFCKHCGTVINSPKTDTMQSQRIPINRSFKPGNFGDTSAHHIPVSAEQVWGRLDGINHPLDKEGEWNYTLAPVADSVQENSLRKPETERLRTAGNIVKPPAQPIPTPQKVAPFEEYSPVIPGQLLNVTEPSLPAPDLGVRLPSPSPIPQRPAMRPHPVQLKKIQMPPQDLRATSTVQHPVMPTEQAVAQELANRLTLENLTGVPLSMQRLEVQPLHPVALMRHEPFSVPASLRLSLVDTDSKRRNVFKSIIITLLIIGIVGALILTFAYVSALHSLSPSKPVLLLIGQALPGKMVTLHGSNFSVGSNVKLSIDTIPLVQTHIPSSAPTSYSTNTSSALVKNIPTQKAIPSSNNETIVRSDGTFDKNFTIPLEWKLGTTHSIQAYVQNQQTALSVRLDFVVEQSASLPASTSEPAATAVKSAPHKPTTPATSPTVRPSPTDVPTQPPVPTSTPIVVACISVTPQQLSFKSVAGQGNAPGQGVMLANCGDAGSWSSSVTTSGGGNWLSVNTSSGKLNGGSMQRVSIITQGANSGTGTYTGRVTFIRGSTAVNVNVSLIVALQPSCIQTSTSALAFTAVAGLSDPASQSVMLTNCGGAGSWSALTSTDDGSNWLNLSSTSGMLNASQNVTVGASNLATRLAASIYTGHITFTSGTSSVTVRVTLTITAPSACLQASSQSLIFASAKGAQSASQAITMTNCGGAGNWSAVVATDNGGDWLTITPIGDTLNAGATEQLAITTLQTSECGAYTGHITITMITSTGSTSAVVNVTLNQTC